jgi:hypothetical protein
MTRFLKFNPETPLEASGDIGTPPNITFLSESAPNPKAKSSRVPSSLPHVLSSARPPVKEAPHRASDSRLMPARFSFQRAARSGQNEP